MRKKLLVTCFIKAASGVKHCYNTDRSAGAHRLPQALHLNQDPKHPYTSCRREELGVVVHTCNPSIHETEAGGLQSQRPAWATYLVKRERIDPVLSEMTIVSLEKEFTPFRNS
jgi:hypothetical protein